jgi:glycyl-tRNA synthetase beta subunit
MAEPTQEELLGAFEKLKNFEETDVVGARKVYFKLHKDVEGRPPQMKILSDLQVPELLSRAAELLAKSGVEVDGGSSVAEKSTKKKEEKSEEVEAVEPKTKAKKTKKTKKTEAAATTAVDIDELAKAVADAVASNFVEMAKNVTDLTKSVNDLREAVDELAKASGDGVLDDMRALNEKVDSFRNGLSNAFGAAALEVLGD